MLKVTDRLMNSWLPRRIEIFSKIKINTFVEYVVTMFGIEINKPPVNKYTTLCNYIEKYNSALYTDIAINFTCHFFKMILYKNLYLIALCVQSVW